MLGVPSSLSLGGVGLGDVPRGVIRPVKDRARTICAREESKESLSDPDSEMMTLVLYLGGNPFSAVAFEEGKDEPLLKAF